MAGAGPGDLDLLAHDLLDTSVEALDTIPGYLPALSGAPPRRFVSPGQPALDCCDQLTVHAPNIVERPAGPKPVTGRLNVPNLLVTITRCVPEGKIVGQTFQPPAPTSLEAAAAQIHADGWALWNHIWNMIRNETFLARCQQVTVGNLTALIPDGGCGGWTLGFAAVLDGYEEDPGS